MKLNTWPIIFCMVIIAVIPSILNLNVFQKNGQYITTCTKKIENAVFIARVNTEKTGKSRTYTGSHAALFTFTQKDAFLGVINSRDFMRNNIQSTDLLDFTKKPNNFTGVFEHAV